MRLVNCVLPAIALAATCPTAAPAQNHAKCVAQCNGSELCERYCPPAASARPPSPSSSQASEDTTSASGETRDGSGETENGLSRCGADGWVERYSRPLHSWMGTAAKCAAGTSKADLSGEEGGAVSPKRGGEGRRQDGISRCGADGWVERYSRPLKSWMQTAHKCGN